MAVKGKQPQADQTSGCCRVEAVVTVDERGQMVLPKDVREKSGIGPGDKLAVVTWTGDGAVCCIGLLKTDRFSGLVKEILGSVMKDAFSG